MTLLTTPSSSSSSSPLSPDSPFVDVLLPLAVAKPFTYQMGEEKLQRGEIVLVPFRNRQLWGIVWNISFLQTEAYSGQIKPVLQKVSVPPLLECFLQFLEKVARYNYFPLGLVVKLVCHARFFSTPPSPMSVWPSFSLVTNSAFSEEQSHAIHVLESAVQKGGFRPFLMDGVTGSGKTAVYLEAIAEALGHQKQALLLVPEISLTPQTSQRFEKRFGVTPFLWHSGISLTKKRELWTQLLQGVPLVVIGARSALFLPFSALGVIVVDEEHDASYKQEEQIIYHGRDMAVLRASLEKIPIVLVSATPSLETLHNVHQGRYERLVLSVRHGSAQLPHIKSIDMKRFPRQWISPPLALEIRQTLDRGEQAMLFLNRRGYAPVTLCMECGWRACCRQCTVALVMHKKKEWLSCHYCGYGMPIPKECPECQSSHPLVPCGPGVERIEELARKFFPQARIGVLTSDTLHSLKTLHELTRQIHEGALNLVIGTQILAKGHHFPLMTLVAIIDADLGLQGGDLRASERTYQLLHQVSGRSGRENKVGHVWVQSHTPDHPVIQSVCQGERDFFNILELQDREAHFMPPFSRLASLTLRGKYPLPLGKLASQLATARPQSLPPSVQILGPVPLTPLKGDHRWRFLIKASKNFSIPDLLDQWLSRVVCPPSCKMIVDVDPQSFF